MTKPKKPVSFYDFKLTYSERYSSSMNYRHQSAMNVPECQRDTDIRIFNIHIDEMPPGYTYTDLGHISIKQLEEDINAEFRYECAQYVEKTWQELTTHLEEIQTKHKKMLLERVKQQLDPLYKFTTSKLVKQVIDSAQ